MESESVICVALKPQYTTIIFYTILKKMSIAHFQ